MPGKIRVMIVADHPIMLDGLRITFSRQKDMLVVCEANGSAQALREFELYRPDVTLVDLQRPAGEGWRVVNALHQRFPGCAMVVLTTYPVDAANAGNGTSVTVEVSKTASGTEIIAATRRAAQSRRS